MTIRTATPHPSSTPTPAPGTQGGSKGLLARGFASAAIAAAVNLAVFGVASSAGAPMRVTLGASETVIGAVPVLISSIVPLSLALVVTWLIAKRWPRARRVLAQVGLAFSIISVVAPLMLASDGATAAALAIMHVVVGVSWFVALSRRA